MNPSEFFTYLYTDSRISELNDTVIQLNERLVMLNANIIKLSDAINRLSTHIYSNTIQNYTVLSHSDNSSIYNGRPYSRIEGAPVNDDKGTDAFKDLKGYIKAGKSLTEVAEGGIKIFEAVKTLPPAMEKAKKWVQIFNNTFKVLGSTAEAIEAAGVVEEIAALGGVAAGLEGGILAALGLSNPLGWLIGGAVVIGGGAALMLSHDDKEQKPSFIDESEKNANPFLIETKQRERTAEEYVRITKEQNDRMRIPREIEQMKRFLLQQSSIEFDYRKAESNDPVYIKALVAALNESNRLPSHPIKEVKFADAKDLTAFREAYDNGSIFPLKAMPEVEVSEYSALGARIYHYESQKEYDQKRGLHPANPTAAQIKGYEHLVSQTTANYLSHDFAYVQETYRNFMRMPYPEAIKAEAVKVWNDFLQVKETIDKDRKQATSVKRTGAVGIYRETNRPTGNVVNININKSLIEHFTITVRNAKEGVDVLKDKVEEALIEVLGSVIEQN